VPISGPMDVRDVASLRRLFTGTRFDDEVVEFSSALGRAPRSPGELLLVGTEAHEPWHFAAHLDDEARWNGRPELAPTLVRWKVPPGARPHLAIGLDRLEAVRANEALLVVSPDAAAEQLLHRVEDARRRGAVVLAMETDDPELRGLAHESLTVPSSETLPYLDVTEHVVSATAPAAHSPRRSLRSRLARILERG
jgi:hypothetical protein